jgi:hypothetical protein
VAQSLASVAAYRLGSGAELPSRFKEESGEPPLAEIRQRYTSSVELARRLEIRRGGKIASGDAETLEGRLETIWRLIGGKHAVPGLLYGPGWFRYSCRPALCPSTALADDGESLGRVPRQSKSEQARRASRGPGLFGVRPPAQGERQRRHRPRGGRPGADAGRAVKGGLFGPHPNLADLDETGDPRFAVDFRDLYASLIRHWLDVDPTPILGERKATLPLA